MKIIIPSHGRPSRIRTHLMFPAGTDYYVVVGDKSEAAAYKLNKTIDPARIVVHGQGYGIGKARDWILRNMVEEDEWFVMSDDNNDIIHKVSPLYYDKPVMHDFDNRKLDAIYKEACSWPDFMRAVEADVREAAKHNLRLIGYATNSNPFFRKRKYRYVGHVTTKLCVIKKSQFVNFEREMMVREEMQYCADNHFAFGGALINNYIYPNGKHYEAGGIGSNERRIPLKIKENAWLMRTYPGLFRYHNKAGVPANTELVYAFTKPEQVQAWRNQFATCLKAVPPREPYREGQ